MKKIFGVIGGSTCSEEIYEIAYEIGRNIAKSGNILICGGLGGVMEAACKGAYEEGGLTVGILPGNSKEEANKWVRLPIVTGIGEARNVIIIKSSDIVIAIDGEYGTLMELALCGKIKKPLIKVKVPWKIDIGVEAKDAKTAVEMALNYLKEI
ncbi:MAG: TIGR00725 family protein [Candidatus Hydrothermales bacterium]